jgi:hypothetical protein
MSVIPGVPSDNTTLLEVLEDFRQRGYDGTLWVAASGNIRCEGCDVEIPADEVRVHEIRRLEGASDPDDMLAVVAAECTACGRKGTLVVHFGPETSAEEQDAFSKLSRPR